MSLLEKFFNKATAISVYSVLNVLPVSKPPVIGNYL